MQLYQESNIYFTLISDLVFNCGYETSDVAHTDTGLGITVETDACVGAESY